MGVLAIIKQAYSLDRLSNLLSMGLSPEDIAVFYFLMIVQGWENHPEFKCQIRQEINEPFLSRNVPTSGSRCSLKALIIFSHVCAELTINSDAIILNFDSKK